MVYPAGNNGFVGWIVAIASVPMIKGVLPHKIICPNQADCSKAFEAVFMVVDRHGWLRTLLLAAVIVSIGEVAVAQSLSNDSVYSSNDAVAAMVERLDRQEAELARMRAELNAYHQSQGASQANSRLEGLPPLPLPPVNDNSEVFYQLQQQLAALEQVVKQNAEKQAQAATNGGTEVGSDPNMTSKWNDMLETKTKSGDFRTHVGGGLQFDFTQFNNDPNLVVPQAVGGIGPQPNSITLRRARIRLDGTVYETFDYMFETEFANALTSSTASPGQPVAINPAITDFWITWTHLPGLGNIRVGNQKEPMGMEHMMSYRFTDFLERSYLQDVIFGPFTNGFSPGASVFNWSEDERATWAIGAFGNSSDVFGYSLGNDYAITGRLTWLPFYDELTKGRYLWHVGASASSRGPDEGLVRLRTRGNIRSGPPGTLNPIYADTRDMQADSQQVLNFESAIQYGPWSVQAEYAGTWVAGAVQPFAPAVPVDHGTPYFQGGYVEVMYFVTGEHRNYNTKLAAFDRPNVYENAYIVAGRDGTCMGSGAVQVGARYSAMDLNANGINGGDLQSMTFGVNWFLNPTVKVQFNYDLTHRSEVRGVESGFINSFGTRFALDF
jgi:phosphate-selective porin OprO/OprP